MDSAVKVWSKMAQKTTTLLIEAIPKLRMKFIVSYGTIKTFVTIESTSALFDFK